MTMPKKYHRASLFDDPDDVSMDDLRDLPDLTTVGSTDPQHSNNARATWAAHALVAFTDRVGDDEMHSNISDLISDLLHLADALGFTTDSILGRAELQYREEIGGEL